MSCFSEDCETVLLASVAVRKVNSYALVSDDLKIKKVKSEKHDKL